MAKPANAPAITIRFGRRFGSESLGEGSGVRAAGVSPPVLFTGLPVGPDLRCLRVNAGFLPMTVARGGYWLMARRTAASASSQAL
jgi:hypothetical protein